MPQGFNYLTCQIQNARVTFVNGQWQGKLPATHNDSAAVLESCPPEWEFLQAAGEAGWELVAAAPQHDYRVLYLKRERYEEADVPEVL